MRHPIKWNYAIDYVVNAETKQAGFTLPPGVLLDVQWDGKSGEWIYDRLPEPPGGWDGQGAGAWGQVWDAPGQPGDLTEADWQQQAALCAAAAAAMGKLPASLERLLGEIKRPAVDWRSYTQRWLQQRAADDWTYRHPSRRWASQGLVMPSLHSTRLGPLVLVVDTSGSIDDLVLQLFAGGVAGAVEACRPSVVWVLYADAQVHRVDRFEPDDLLTFKAVGGGGTDFRPAFRWVEEHLDDPPTGLVYLTDLAGQFGEQAPDYPVLWASIDPQGKAPWGEVVEVRG